MHAVYTERGFVFILARLDHHFYNRKLKARRRIGPR